MTSISETAAVSIRKGTTDENLAFTGILGEVSADLGFPDDYGDLGLDNNATLRLHNGVTPGGIAMARADMRNLTTQALAVNRDAFGDKNLAYADLSNIEVTNSQVAKENIVATLVSYGLIEESTVLDILLGYAKTDMSNINTSVLATSAGHAGKNLAYADMSNVNTVDLGTNTGHAGKNLTYTDTTNLNTKYLVDPTIHDDLNNNGNKPLAYADMSNVTLENLENVGVELTDRKDAAIDPNAVYSAHYPSTRAVIDYVTTTVNDSLENSGFLKNDYSNSTTYEPLYSADEVHNTFYNDDEHITLPTGQGFVPAEYDPTTGQLLHDSVYYTGIKLMTIEELSSGEESTYYCTYDTEPLQLIVNSLDVNHKLTLAGCQLNINKGGNHLDDNFRNDTPPEILYEPVISTVYAYSDKGDIVTLNIKSQYDPVTKLYTYTLEDVLSSSRRFSEGNSYLIYKNSSESISGLSGYEQEAELVKVILPLYIRVLETTEDGRISKYEYVPSYTKINIEKQSFTITNEEFDNATFELDYNDTFPRIGGAGLLKTDFTNLPGMSDTDKDESTNIPWRINPNVRVPSQKIRHISPASYYTLATIGSVWEAIYDVNGGEDPWDTSDCVHLEGDETISGIKTFLQPIIGTGLVTLNADLAEKYVSDKKYTKGTLVQFGGTAEITIATKEVNAVISDKPGIMLNKDEKGLPIVLTGKTKIRIIGPVHKFDKIILSEEPGIGRTKKWNDFRKTVIAIALEDNLKEEEKLVMCVTNLKM